MWKNRAFSRASHLQQLLPILMLPLPIICRSPAPTGMEIGSLLRCIGVSGGGKQSRGAGLSFRSIPVTIEWQSNRCGEKLCLKTDASYTEPASMNGQEK